MVLGLQVFKSVIVVKVFLLSCKCRKNVGYTCKSPRLFCSFAIFIKQKILTYEKTNLLAFITVGSGCGVHVAVRKEVQIIRRTLAMIDSVDAHGLQRMQTSKSETDFKFKGRDYHSLVSRTPDESLPHVSNELGDTYVDNKIVLHDSGNENVLNKTFTKNDFSSVVDANFLSKSILEGIVYDKTTPQGIVYAASVCYPQTDLYMPLSITVTADGKMSIKRK